jgi:hypothetical protein
VNYGYDYFRSKRFPLAKATDSQEEFSSPESGFSILFPKKPTASFSTTKVDDTIVKVHTYTVRERNTYEISYFDLPHNSDDPKIAAYLLVGGHVQLPLALISYGENCSIGEIESGIRHTPGADSPLSGLYSVVAWASRSSAALCPSGSMNDLT